MNFNETDVRAFQTIDEELPSDPMNPTDEETAKPNWYFGFKWTFVF